MNLEKYRNENEHLVKYIEGLKKENEALGNKNSALQAQLDKHTKLQQQHGVSFEEAVQQIGQLIGDYTELSKQRNDEVSTLNSQIGFLRQQTKTNQASSQNLDQMIQLQDEIDQLKRKNETLEKSWGS